VSSAGGKKIHTGRKGKETESAKDNEPPVYFPV
jgi:hypothetical protein